MFPNNSENICNLRKLHQLLFHFCQEDTFFTQFLNHNSDCRRYSPEAASVNRWVNVPKTNGDAPNQDWRGVYSVNSKSFNTVKTTIKS